MKIILSNIGSNGNISFKKIRKISFEKILAWTILLFLIPTLFIYIGQLRPIQKGKVLGTSTRLPPVDTETIKRPAKKKNESTLPKIYANSYVLIDAQTAYPIIESNSKTKVPIASITKIMTAIIVLENYNLTDELTVPAQVTSAIGSDIQLLPGEVLTVESLLHGLLIQSGNDAAIALAYKENSLEKFVEKMNQKAKDLGLNDTLFKDPAGLDDTSYSTAFEVAILSSYAMKNPIFAKIVKIPEYTIVSVNGKFSHQLKNSNRLILPDEQYFVSQATGIKTGYTPGAGHCLVTAVEKNGHLLIAVVLNTTENTIVASAKESKKLFDWTLDNLEL